MTLYLISNRRVILPHQSGHASHFSPKLLDQFICHQQIPNQHASMNAAIIGWGPESKVTSPPTYYFLKTNI
jgi:hypothetical protein